MEEGPRSAAPYVQGFIVPVPHARREDYRKMAQDAWPMFEGYGAIRVIEAWGDDVPAGKITDFARSVEAGEEENVVFSYIEWPSREVCDAAAEKMQSDESMMPPEGFVMPFDGKRMVYGGFTPIVTLGE
ncbi:DUF1428 domain-containing protein [Novosphingobium album (ex Liu et al. 2023)]|uniref:DUF1428 domain-containing protein n=1 Tax=Novosphingobium album (ex Liu et al. 2023) TaxID=3031130 RepID=A0ABT5WPK2_9SPHN|nr:DUF1428 domain-containing protein [Novosphingobium album (ex Liu et al. 2023)]MDE8651968.1 DUF1428 domain-containing protein [Novosphingobium album (ex Liu et al. 2023)]